MSLRRQNSGIALALFAANHRLLIHLPQEKKIARSLSYGTSIPSYDSLKYRRYSLCLSFLQEVVEEFEDLQPEFHQDFQQMAYIACYVDDYVDQLSFSQKQLLLDKFGLFFNKLKSAQGPSEFEKLCMQFIASNDLPAASYCDYSVMHAYMLSCRESKLNPQLLHFSLAVLKSSMLKQKAESFGSVRDALKLEGVAAVEFLMAYLKSKGVLDKDQKMEGYFLQLERMLNLADELADAKKDWRVGQLGYMPNLAFHLRLSLLLMWQLVLTTLAQPIRFIRHLLRFSYRAIRLR